jgi:tRNA pseudouridine(38-40) synthase
MMGTFCRYCISFQYVGTGYCGVAISKSSKQPSVLGVVGNALTKFTKSNLNWQNMKPSSRYGFLSLYILKGNFPKASYLISRTDAGVHALRNAFQVDIKGKCDPNGKASQLPPSSIKNGLNYFLECSRSLIYVQDVVAVDMNFNASSNAKSRTYMYRIMFPKERRKISTISGSIRTTDFSLFHQDRAWIIDRPLDIEAMNEACSVLIGEQDFSSFRNSGCQAKTPVRNVLSIDLLTSCQTTRKISTSSAMTLKSGIYSNHALVSHRDSFNLLVSPLHCIL